MAAIIQFKCRACESDLSIVPSKTDRVFCPGCKSSLEVLINESLIDRHIVTTCVSCGHDTFYVQKDFNRNLGMLIVTAGFALSIYFFAGGEPFYAMAVLFASALLDFLIYRLVGEVTVCYACHAIYRGFERNPKHQPFDLKDLEKFGGRDPRIGNN